MKSKIKEILAQMSLEEKADLLSGKNFWETKGVEKLNISGQMMTDGPHGLRKQTGDADHLGINNSEPATSFPTASVAACSFNPELIEKMGESLGDKCIREDVAVILGPGVNMKRSPLCGRNFEYYSEDPFLAGKVAAGLIRGVQSKGIGTSLKHFAANNQEYARMVNDSVVDERALHEVYLPAFEIAVKESQPATVMCSYNKINGTYAASNKWLLTDLLRNEWGFEGLVVTDWGALEDPVLGVKAGLDLEMPYSGPENAAKIVDAVKTGKLSEKAVDECAGRVLSMLLKAAEKKESVRTEEMDDELACEIASESMVLLKNDNVLPLSSDEKILVIGEMADKIRYQGAGSSKINPSYLHSVLQALEESNKGFEYLEGYHKDETDTDEMLLKEAVEAAKTANKVVIVAGLPDQYESEGFDRDVMSMPENQLRLIKEVTAVNDHVIVVLQLGAPVELPFKDDAEGILLSYLAGQACGKATLDVLYGNVNPSGHLAETWPVHCSDAPSSLYYPGSLKTSEYRESIYVGYRYYNKVNCPVNYPFGHGLSYTTFSYDSMSIEESGDGYNVNVNVTNTGNVAGKEVVQIYVGKSDSKIFRTAPELKGFAKVELAPGQTKTVTVFLGQDAFRYYNTKVNAFCHEGGKYEIYVGASSRDYRLEGSVELSGDGKEELLLDLYKDLEAYKNPSYPFKVDKDSFEKLLGRKVPSAELAKKGYFTTSSCLEELKDTFIGKKMLGEIKKQMGDLAADNSDDMARMGQAMLYCMPIRSMTMTGAMSHTQIEGIVDMANGHYLKGIKKMQKK